MTKIFGRIEVVREYDRKELDGKTLHLRVFDPNKYHKTGVIFGLDLESRKAYVIHEWTVEIEAPAEGQGVQ